MIGRKVFVSLRSKNINAFVVDKVRQATGGGIEDKYVVIDENDNVHIVLCGCVRKVLDGHLFRPAAVEKTQPHNDGEEKIIKEEAVDHPPLHEYIGDGLALCISERYNFNIQDPNNLVVREFDDGISLQAFRDHLKELQTVTPENTPEQYRELLQKFNVDEAVNSFKDYLSQIKHYALRIL